MTCWHGASFVGGMFSISPPFCDKQSLPGLVHTVIRMTNLSMIGMMSSMCAAVGVWARLHSVGETSLNLFQTGHAARFPLPAKPDVVSHPVIAWKAGNTLHLSLPSFGAMWDASRYRDVFLLFKMTQWAVHMSVCWRCWPRVQQHLCQQFLVRFSCILASHRR